MGLLKKLFSSQPKTPPVNFNEIGVDLHSHLIPGIDDGSKNMEETILMLKKFADLGYKKIITTPHIMSDFYKNTPEIILGGLENVKEAIEKNSIPIQIEAAAEYYSDFHFEELIQQKNLLTFEGNHVLFELSFIHEPQKIKETIFNLCTEGYQPILAHVERYPYYFNRFDILDDFINRGCILQMNINSLLGQYGPQVKKMAETLIDKDLIQVIGSDCHHLGHLEMMESLKNNSYLYKISQKEDLLNKKWKG